MNRSGNNRGTRPGPPWSTSDIKKLHNLIADGARLPVIASELGRSKNAVLKKANRLKIKTGVPAGFESLSAAAARAGLAAGNTAGLRRILRRFGVTLKTNIAIARNRRRRRHFVDPDEVDRAIALWTRSESAAAAARRLGMSWTVFFRALACTDLAARHRKGRMGRWLLLPDEVEMVVRKHREIVENERARLARMRRDSRGRYLPQQPQREERESDQSCVPTF